MSLFTKKNLPHWTELYKNAVEKVKSGDMSAASNLAYKSIGMDPETGKQRKREQKKMKEDYETYSKAMFLAHTSRIASITPKIPKREVGSDLLSEYLELGKLVTELLQGSTKFDIHLLADIDSSLIYEYSHNRPEKPEDRLRHFFKYFNQYLKYLE